jgi:aspartate kinase
MGERISALVFCSALKALGAKAIYIGPDRDNWPIITDSNYMEAKPELTATKRLAKRNLEPLLGETIPVVCGFLGLDKHGNLTTLGRGGSDVTALVLANCLEADEVILVKDVEGVLSADPKIVPNARPFEKLDIHDMFTLARGGARIIRSEALKYKLKNQRLRVVSFSLDALNSGGTEITGVFESNSAEISQHANLSAVTVVCEIDSESLKELFSSLSGETIFGVSTGRKSVTVFASLRDVSKTLNKIHTMGLFKAVTCRDKIGMIEVANPVFIDSPGWVAEIAGKLASEKVNIIEITTSKATINVFVDESRLKDGLRAVGDLFEA